MDARTFEVVPLLRVTFAIRVVTATLVPVNKYLMRYSVHP